MPVSHHEGKQWTCDRLRRLNPIDILDVGPGEGIYSILMRPELNPEAVWECVEIHEPYVEKFDLLSKYDVVNIADVRELHSVEFLRDVVIFGDVIEHMTKDDAVELLKRVKTRAEAIVVSIPIVHMPQGEYDGNPHEAHLADWTFDEMHETMDWCEAFEGNVLGVFFWRCEVDGSG